jgi:hypothetical protein
MKDGRKRCVNCKEFERTQAIGDGYIGYCRKYGLPVKDTLSGCAERKEVNKYGDE